MGNRVYIAASTCTLSSTQLKQLAWALFDEIFVYGNASRKELIY
jgi:hypothetical protein